MNTEIFGSWLVGVEARQIGIWDVEDVDLAVDKCELCDCDSHCGAPSPALNCTQCRCGVCNSNHGCDYEFNHCNAIVYEDEEDLVRDSFGLDLAENCVIQAENHAVDT